MKRYTLIILLAALFLAGGNAYAKSNFRLVYWNIQNGMWDGQTDNYDRFVSWVKSYSPDVCVWCEAQSLYVTGTDTNLPKAEAYLPAHWDELAARYGHKYVYIGGQRDGYPQAITSRYPIENIQRIIGNQADTVIRHGAGWARVKVRGKAVNIVTLHLAPHKWRPGVKGKAARDSSAARHEGDFYRRGEIQYICEHTVATHQDAAGEYWMMLGDFNSQSRADNWVYGYESDDSRLLVHDYILQQTPYVDAIGQSHPGEFHQTTYHKSRIDFVYLTPALYDKVAGAAVCRDPYVLPVRNPEKISNFYHPSDHLPIIIDFKL